MVADLAAKLESTKKELAETEIKLDECNRLEKEIQTGRERQAELRTENASLKVEMDDLKLRIEKLNRSRRSHLSVMRAATQCRAPASPHWNDYRQRERKKGITGGQTNLPRKTLPHSSWN